MGISTAIEGGVWVHRVSGRVTLGEVLEAVVEGLPAHPSLWDFTAAAVEPWDGDEALGRLEPRVSELGSVVAALVAPHPETFGRVRVAFEILRARVPIDGHVFCSEARARSWLCAFEHRDDPGKASRVVR